MASTDKLMFYKFLDKAKVYFEYGCGGSTYQACLRNNIHKIYSVESDKQWLMTLQQQKLLMNKVNFMYVEMGTPPNAYGYPGRNSTLEQWVNYSNQIRHLTSDEQQQIDLVLIDGRFRVACCLKCFDVINADCSIVFDDFFNRKEYHIVLDYYDIVLRTTDECMVILKKKKNVASVPQDIIKKYELISH